MTFSRVNLIILVLLLTTLLVTRAEANTKSVPSSQSATEATASAAVSEEEASGASESEDRIYFLKRCAGSGCPYAAAWLAHINLYRRVRWYTESTKMEAASFNIFDTAKFKFQLSDPDAYYVHHMSMFEHLNHKAHGFEVAKNKTLILSTAAYHGECDNLTVSSHKEYLALIPFYGGRPPNVTSDLSVKSIGQGNSLVDASTKALYSMATICSSLKYFGQIIVGVARTEDRVLINSAIDKLGASARHRINIVQFQLAKPAHLPFNLLAWGQHYVKQYNCHQFLPPRRNTTTRAKSGAAPSSIGSSFATSGMDRKNGNIPGVGRSWHAKGGEMIVDNYGSNINTASIPKEDVYDICWPSTITPSFGPPFNLVYAKKNIDFMFQSRAAAPVEQEEQKAEGVEKRRNLRHKHGHNTTSSSNNNSSSSSSSSSSSTRSIVSGAGHTKKIFPIRYVYYTECDQVVRFDDSVTFRALSSASNESTFFVARRKEKARESIPAEYMSDLNQWRECGSPGYSINWPSNSYVQQDT